MADDSIREEIASLTDRIRREGQLDRNGKNSIKEVIKGNVEISNKIDVTNQLLGSIRSMLRDTLQDMARASRTDTGFTPAATPPGGGDGVTPDSDTTPPAGGLGGLGIGAAAVLGTLAGVIAGQLKAIQVAAKALSPTKFYNRIVNNIRGMRLAIAMNIELIKSSFVERLTALKGTVVNSLNVVGDFVRGLFGNVTTDSRLSKIVSNVMGRIKLVTDTFVDAFRTVSSVVSNVTGRVSEGVKTVATIASKFSLFRALVSTISNVVSKIFAPIAIIITAFDTIKGVIDGFVEDGITGAIEGGIVGFFNSLIFGPLDMLKSAAAWVLGFFGFEKAKTALNSFSFATLFSDLIGSIFEPIHGVTDMIVGLFDGIFGDGWSTFNEGFTRTFAGFWNIISAPMDTLISLVRGIFSLAGLELPEFSIKDFVSGAVDSAIGFVKGLFGFGGDELQADVERQERLLRETRTADAVAINEDGSFAGATNRTVNGLNDVRGAEIDLERQGLTVATRAERAALIAEQEAELERRRAALEEFQNRPSLMEMISGAASSATEWLSGLFSFDSTSSILSSGINAMFLPANIAWKAFTSVGSWIAGVFGFDDTSETLAEAGEYSIGDLVMNTLDTIWEKLKEVFDFLPNIEEIKASLISMLPSWMRPESTEEARASLEQEIQELESGRSAAPPRSDINAVQDVYTKTREEYDEEIEDLRRQLAELPQAKRGGIIEAPDTGTPVMLHGTEAIIPLDNPKAQSYLTGMNSVTEAASVNVTRRSNNSMVSNSGNNIDNSSRTTTTTYVSPSRPRVRPDPSMPM